MLQIKVYSLVLISNLAFEFHKCILYIYTSNINREVKVKVKVKEEEEEEDMETFFTSTKSSINYSCQMKSIIWFIRERERRKYEEKKLIKLANTQL